MDKAIKETPKKKMSWRKTISANGITKSLEVEELDNGGFLINYNKYGEINGKYKDEYKKFYSETNPLAKEDPVKEDDSNDLDVILSMINDDERIF